MVKDASTHRKASNWIAACIVVHAFAMKCEAEERGSNDVSSSDPFIPDAHEEVSSGSENGGLLANNQQPANGKEFREKLKQAWFRHKTSAVRRGACHDRGLFSSDSETSSLPSD
jgi:hypothetical protein